MTERGSFGFWSVRSAIAEASAVDVYGVLRQCARCAGVSDADARVVAVSLLQWLLFDSGGVPGSDWDDPRVLADWACQLDCRIGKSRFLELVEHDGEVVIDRCRA